MIKEVLQQLEPLDAQIDALCSSTDDAEMANTTTHAAELAELSAQENMLLQRCTSLTPEDRVFLARRPDRPHIGEIIDNLFTDFFEQCGDRQCKEDAAILCGIARFHGMPVTVLGHRKGTTLEENLRCNFGMPGPEGYRKALRVMKQAEKFRRPIITFIDTPGAYPGKDAEERGQGEAIARNLMEMSGLTVPVIAVVTGEGSSGGALALGVALIFMEPYRLSRLSAFLNPWSSPKGEGYQLIQSLYALGSGGWFGVGLFNSRQKFAFLPFAESDFILSVIGEETGFIGLLAFFALLGFIVYRGIRIASKTKNIFSYLLAMGITFIFGIQVLVNALVVTGSIPPTGLPLPLVSSGNTSIIIFLAEFGVLYNISKGGD